MDTFYHISNGKNVKYLCYIDDFMNGNEDLTINEIQMPIVADINIFLYHLLEYSREKGVNIELCDSRPIRIFTKLTNDFVFRYMRIICKSLYEKQSYQNDMNMVYPYRKMYNNPKDPSENKYTKKYLRNYKKSIIHFRIATFYGYDILIQPRNFNKYINDHIFSDDSYSVKFKTEEELDIKNLEYAFTKNAIFSRLNVMNPYTPTQKILLYTNNKNLKYIKKLYEINDIEELKTEEFYHKINRYPFVKERSIKNTINLGELKNIIARRSETPWDIYSKNPNRNNYTNEIIKYHNAVMNYYIEKYFDRKTLLDIGAGPLRQIGFYEKINFKKVGKSVV